MPAPLIFSYPGVSQSVVVSEQAQQTFLRYRQAHLFRSEAGGLLFAKISATQIAIQEATSPSRRDYRTRGRFILDLVEAQKVIAERFSSKLHYVGEWHTHPEPVPRPTERDLKTIASVFEKSQHRLRSLILIIVGNGDPPSIWCSLHRSADHIQLSMHR